MTRNLLRILSKNQVLTPTNHLTMSLDQLTLVKNHWWKVSTRSRQDKIISKISFIFTLNLKWLQFCFLISNHWLLIRHNSRVYGKFMSNNFHNFTAIKTKMENRIRPIKNQMKKIKWNQMNWNDRSIDKS